MKSIKAKYWQKLRYLCGLVGVVTLGACEKKQAEPRIYNFDNVSQLTLDSIFQFDRNACVLFAQNGVDIFKFEVTVTEANRLPLASATKWLSGAVIMSLVETGKLALSDTVGKYLPAFSRYGKGRITIGQLMSHTSGLAGFSRYETNGSLTLAQAADSIARRVPLLYAPGSTFSYGDVSMQVAGRVAEVVSGQSWAELFKEKITIPCQMPSTAFVRQQNPLIASGCSSTARDYLHFLQMLLNNGKYDTKFVLSAATIQQMEQSMSREANIVYTPYLYNPYTPTGRQQPLRYGIGLWRDLTDGNNAVELSSPGVTGVHPWIDRKHSIAGVVFTQSSFAKTWLTSLKIRELIRKEVD